MLDGKVALVTGASRGIGRAIAIGLGAQGAKVVVNYQRNRQAADEVVAAIAAAGGVGEAIQADVGVPGEVERLIDDTVSHFGGIDILVNNAGMGLIGALSETPEENYDQLFSFTRAAFFSMKHAAAVMRDGGRIINVTSIVTRFPIGQVAYAGSKAAIEYFTRGFAHEVGVRGITVNAVQPGATDTDMFQALGPERRISAPARTAMRRLGTAEDIAKVVVFLAGPDGEWVTSEVIGASGGRT